MSYDTIIARTGVQLCVYSESDADFKDIYNFKVKSV